MPDSSPGKQKKKQYSPRRFLFRSDSFRREKDSVIVHCAVGTPIIAFASRGSVGTYKLLDQRSVETKKIQVCYRWKAVCLLLSNAGENYFISFVSLQPQVCLKARISFSACV